MAHARCPSLANVVIIATRVNDSSTLSELRLALLYGLTRLDTSSAAGALLARRIRLIIVVGLLSRARVVENDAMLRATRVWRGGADAGGRNARLPGDIRGRKRCLRGRLKGSMVRYRLVSANTRYRVNSSGIDALRGVAGESLEEYSARHRPMSQLRSAAKRK